MVKFIDNLDEAFEAAGLNILEIFSNMNYVDEYNTPILIVSKFQGNYNLDIVEGESEYNSLVHLYTKKEVFVTGGSTNIIITWAREKNSLSVSPGRLVYQPYWINL